MSTASLLGSPPTRSTPAPRVAPRLRQRERGLGTGISPWLAPVAMLLTQDLTLPLYFRRITVLGRQGLPRSGPLLLAPTHKSRWDALLLPHAAGRRVTGRDCRFMVTVDEMRGLQGWLLQRLGCFPVNQARPSLLSLRYAFDLLAAGQQLVVFPEGEIRRQPVPEEPRLHQGLARLALMAASKGAPVPVVPVGIAYSHPWPRPLDAAAVSFGAPLTIEAPAEGPGQGRRAALAFNHRLAAAMAAEERRARQALAGGGPAGEHA